MSKEQKKVTFIPAGSTQPAHKLDTAQILLDTTDQISPEKTIRETACDFSRILLRNFQAAFGAEIFSFCAVFGYMEWQNVLRLKGAFGAWQPCGLEFEVFPAGDQFLGRVVRDRQSQQYINSRPEVIPDSQTALFSRGKNTPLALLATPVFDVESTLSFVLILGSYSDPKGFEALVNNPDFLYKYRQLCRHLATLYKQAIGVVKSRLARAYTDNERNLMKTLNGFYDQSDPVLRLDRFVGNMAEEALAVLNAGNPEKPFYTNYLFYEYLPEERNFALRSFKKEKYQEWEFSIGGDIFDKYVRDKLVKSIESQVPFITARGAFPCVIRKLQNKLEVLEVQAEADWAPSGNGSAFFVPLFEGDEPLGLFVFLSKIQRRCYVNRHPVYLGEERRKYSLNHLKCFRSLQPIMARELIKFRKEAAFSIVDRLVNANRELRQAILFDDVPEMATHLAEYIARDLNCEACIIYLRSEADQSIIYKGSHGFRELSLVQEYCSAILLDKGRRALPHWVLRKQQPSFKNSEDSFRNLSSGSRNYFKLGLQLKSNGIRSYIAHPVGSIGVIEVFNSRNISDTGRSAFDKQDETSLGQICGLAEAIVHRMEATNTRVQSEREKATRGLLLELFHELKNPLYATTIFARRLQELVADIGLADGDEILQMAEYLVQNTAKAHNFLKDLQDFQKIVAASKFEAVDLSESLELVLQSNAELFREKKIRIEDTQIHRPFLVEGDRHQLNQVFTNLVLNAVDAMPDGGELRIEIEPLETQIQVTVSDTGTGIPAELKDRLFETFVSSKGNDQSRGLGLAICRRIISMHHGNISFVDSQIGTGTTFVVNLPLLERPNVVESPNGKAFPIH